jgi:hypothetical protein
MHQQCAKAHHRMQVAGSVDRPLLARCLAERNQQITGADMNSLHTLTRIGLSASSDTASTARGQLCRHRHLQRPRHPVLRCC